VADSRTADQNVFHQHPQERFLLFTHTVAVPFIDGNQIVMNSRAARPEIRTASALRAGLLTEPGSGRQSESSPPPELRRRGMPPGRLALTRW
jgi:hypothetical protein